MYVMIYKNKSVYINQTNTRESSSDKAKPHQEEGMGVWTSGLSPGNATANLSLKTSQEPWPAGPGEGAALWPACDEAKEQM